MNWSAEKLNNKWIIRPKNSLGTCGWYPRSWSAFFVKAKNKNEALYKFYLQIKKQKGK